MGWTRTHNSASGAEKDSQLTGHFKERLQTYCKWEKEGWKHSSTYNHWVRVKWLSLLGLHGICHGSIWVVGLGTFPKNAPVLDMTWYQVLDVYTLCPFSATTRNMLTGMKGLVLYPVWSHLGISQDQDQGSPHKMHLCYRLDTAWSDLWNPISKESALKSQPKTMQ